MQDDAFERNVRQRVAEAAETAEDFADTTVEPLVAEELLNVMKKVNRNVSQFGSNMHVTQFLANTFVITDDLLVKATKCFIDEWSCQHNDARAAQDAGMAPLTTFEWAMGKRHHNKRFNMWTQLHSVSPEEYVRSTPKQLNLNMSNLKYVLLKLYQELRHRRLLVDTREEEDDEDNEVICESHFPRVDEIMKSCYEICLHELKIHVNMPGGFNNNSDKRWMLYDATNSQQRMTSRTAQIIYAGDLTPFQHLLHRLRFLLTTRNYRKSGSILYEPHLTSNKRWTGAWKLAYTNQESTFDTFVTDVVNTYLDEDSYLDLTSSFGIREAALKQLEKEEQPECPTIIFNRLFISFRNAIVHMLGAVFPFDQVDRWQEIADAKNNEWSTFSQACAQRLASIGVHVEPFDLASRTMEETGECMRIRPPTSDDATIQFIDEDIPEELFQLRFDGSNFAESADCDQDVNPAEPWTSAIFTYMDHMGTPDFDSVQTTQKFDMATRFWDCASMGRAFFPGKTLDNCHFFPMHQGRAGTGKSLKLQILQSYFPVERLGILSSTQGEKTFWSTGMQDKWVLFWLEVQNRDSPPLDRGTFQQLIGYELVNLPQKHGKSIMKEWSAPIFLAGNEYFNYEDSSGSLRRRTLTFLYDHKPKGGRDPNLNNKIRKRRGPLLLKMLHSYHLQLMLFPGMDWEKELPIAKDASTKVPIIGKIMTEFHQRAISELDPLQAFVTQRDVFDLGDDFMMSEKYFVDEYNIFRKSRNKSIARWTEAHYQIVFENLNIRRGTGDMQDPTTGVIKSMACLFGIAPKDTEGVVM